MRSSNVPLLSIAIGIATVGVCFGVILLGNRQSPSAIMPPSTPALQAASAPPNGGNTNSSDLIMGGTHAEAKPHSTNIQSAGDYHIEAQLSKSGKLELYIYGQTERQLSPISTLGMDLMMEATAMPAGEDGVPIRMQPKPYPTDPKGTASRFIGQFARRPDQEQVSVTLTLPIDDRTYRVSWRPEELQPGMIAPQSEAMPQAVGADAATKLFLTPGGLYTTADIAANGGMTASQKYGSQMSSHNAHPKRGDRICPITDTVANPKFAWVVGGKTYLFCCPPCIEEFVKRAKETPETVKAPENYVRL